MVLNEEKGDANIHRDRECAVPSKVFRGENLSFFFS